MASVEEIVAAIIKALEEQRTANPSRRDDDKKKIDDRHLKLEDFQGKEEDWADWAFTLKRMIKGKNAEAWRIMNEVEKASREDMEAMALTADQGKIAGELYDILCTFDFGRCIKAVVLMYREVRCVGKSRRLPVPGGQSWGPGRRPA
jgi:hypothetical protein